MTTRITTQGREASPARLALMAGMNRQEVIKLTSAAGNPPIFWSDNSRHGHSCQLL